MLSERPIPMQIKKYDITIIGGGASGLCAAITAAGNGASVCVLEHLDRLAKKITATGNGKCNFTNMYTGNNVYRGKAPAFAYRAVNEFGPEDTIAFFKRLGIPPTERNGYVYPLCESAASVRNALVAETKRLGIKVFLNAAPVSVKKSGDEFETKLEDGTVIESRRLIVATGGRSGQNLGTDGSSYELLKPFGLCFVKQVPALVPLKSDNAKYFRAASGTRFKACVRLLEEGQKEIVSESGEVLFTDYGISGIPVMQISRYAAYALSEGKKLSLKIDFMEDFTEEEIVTDIEERLNKEDGKGNYEMMFNGLLQPKLVLLLIKYLGLKPDETVMKKNIKIKNAVSFIKGYTININGTKEFEISQVTAGGIDTDELCELTMEAKKVKGLYITGELADIDGTCGGYNLQWAWTSGYLAGKAASCFN